MHPPSPVMLGSTSPLGFDKVFGGCLSPYLTIGLRTLHTAKPQSEKRLSSASAERNLGQHPIDLWDSLLQLGIYLRGTAGIGDGHIVAV